MNNEKFLDTLMICGKLKDLEFDVIDRLKDSNLDIELLCKKIHNIFKINTTEYEEYTVILRLLNRLIKACEVRPDKEAVIEQFLKIIALRSEVICEKDIKFIRGGIYGHPFKYLGLSKDLKVFRVIQVNYKKLNINGKETIITTKNKENGIDKLLINGVDYDICGILLKDNKLTYIENNLLKLFKAVINKDYDLAFITHINHIHDLSLIYGNTSDISNKDYLDTLLILGTESRIDPEDWWNVYNSEIQFNKLIDILSNLFVSSLWLNLLSRLIINFETRKLNKDAINKEVNKLYNALNLHNNEYFVLKIYNILKDIPDISVDKLLKYSKI